METRAEVWEKCKIDQWEYEPKGLGMSRQLTLYNIFKIYNFFYKISCYRRVLHNMLSMHV
jgi:hypothetical protein